MVIGPLVPSAAPGREHRRVRIGRNVVVGGAAVPVIAGPCSVENGYVAHADAMATAGADVLRGCVYKPRTRPGTFQGLGVDGLELLDEARRRTGLPVVSEVLSPDQLDHLLPHVDVLQIGARSMQNTPLLRAVGEVEKPVILKRGLAATYEEWLAAAEYITRGGNHDVILCERGIRTFETATRNTLDISAIPVLREMTNLPIIVDPSHAAGRAAWVPSLAIAAVAAGADGLLIEAHPDPAHAWSDGAQALTPQMLAEVITATQLIAPTVRSMEMSTLTDCRDAIDVTDRALAQLLDRRAALVAAAQEHKGAGAFTRDEKREAEIHVAVGAMAPRLGAENASLVMEAIISACLDAARPESPEREIA